MLVVPKSKPNILFIVYGLLWLLCDKSTKKIRIILLFHGKNVSLQH